MRSIYETSFNSRIFVTYMCKHLVPYNAYQIVTMLVCKANFRNKPHSVYIRHSNVCVRIYKKNFISFLPILFECHFETLKYFTYCTHCFINKTYTTFDVNIYYLFRYCENLSRETINLKPMLKF